MATKMILGEGPKNAKIVFIGEAPGVEEEKKGRPFVGRAGKFLDKQLKLHKIDRKKVYITNVVKVRCIGPPKPKLIKKYLPMLKRELKQIKPEVIVLLGKIAAKNVPLVFNATYIELPHPSAAMRFPTQRKRFEAGMAKIELYTRDLQK
ncbi:MAG: uracil-DNA glycosylase [Candidatus Nanoarchaeia archaeon]